MTLNKDIELEVRVEKVQEIMSILEVEIEIEMDKSDKGLGCYQIIDIAKGLSPDLLAE